MYLKCYLLQDGIVMTYYWRREVFALNTPKVLFLTERSRKQMIELGVCSVCNEKGIVVGVVARANAIGLFGAGVTARTIVRAD